MCLEVYDLKPCQGHGPCNIDCHNGMFDGDISAFSAFRKFSLAQILILFNSQSQSIPCLSLPSTNLSRALYMGRYVLYNLNLHFFEERQGIYTIHAYPWLSHGLWWIWVKVLASKRSCNFFSSVTEWVVTDWNLTEWVTVEVLGGLVGESQTCTCIWYQTFGEPENLQHLIMRYSFKIFKKYPR